MMNKDDFAQALRLQFDEFRQTLTTHDGDWTVKGFIDVFSNIYTISVDTKVLSKIVELMIFPVIARFAGQHGYQMILSEFQNHYPDISFITSDGSKIALDIKSTYRTGPESVTGLTLGAFTGYFRQRTSTKNITFPYDDYEAHFVLGIIYSRCLELIDERRVYRLHELLDIVSVVKDFDFLVQEKWRLAGERPGSGNTKNIGSVQSIRALVDGQGPFLHHGEKVFDDYWRNYLTKDMALAIDSEPPYSSLAGYWHWRNRIE